jgi:cation diffusion facilitator family transporter
VALTRKSRAALVSVASNTALVTVKVAVGVLTGSVSVLSEAIHSANDLFAAGIAFVSTRVSDRPTADCHPFGHGKAESISGAVEAAFIVLAALWIVVEAIGKLVRGGEVESVGLATAVMAGSAAVNAVVAWYLFKVAREEDSLALEADAHHLSTDVYTSIGVSVGLGTVWLTGWHVLDPLVALAMAVVIGRIGWRLTLQAGQQLMDASLPSAELALIRAALASEPGLVSWHRLRTRKSGSERHVDLHAVLPAAMSLGEAHEVALRIEAAIVRLFPKVHVVVHMDPDSHSNAAAESASPASPDGSDA